MRWVVGAIAVAALAGSAVAADTVVLTNVPGEGTTNGGAFLANTGSRPDFKTFCLETSEFIKLGFVGYEYTISDEAKLNGGLGPDPISDTTREIYAAYLKGAVGAIISSSDANVIADAVQRAIWHEEGESGSGFGSDSFAQTLWNWFDPGATGGDHTIAGYHNVHVMNVYLASGNDGFGGDRRQDMLILVPLPSASGFACAGLLGVAALRRRRG